MLPDINSIKIRRQKLGIKQKELAFQAQVSQSLIAKLESGKVEPSYNVVKKILSILENLEHKNEKNCSEVMSTNLIYLKKDDTVEKATEIMKKNSISQLPIFENKRVIGSVNESLILDKILEGMKKSELFAKKVDEIMKEPFPIIGENTPTSIALPLLKTSEAILISKKDKIVGIITKANLL